MKTVLLAILAGAVALTAAAQDLDITLTKKNNAIDAAVTNTTTNTAVTKDTTVETTGDVVVTIRCHAFDCKDTSVLLGSTGFTPTRATETVSGKTVNVLTATIPALSINTQGSTLTIRDKNADVVKVSLKKKEEKNDDDDEDIVEATDKCSGVTLQDITGSIVTPQFLITPGASIQGRTTDPIDEDDVVSIHVISTDQDLLRSLEVTRTSATRTTGTLTIAGSNVKIPVLKRENAEEQPRCFYRTYEVSDLAPGEVTVDIAARVQTKRTTLGTLKFNVNHLYDGIISFGPVWTNLTDRAYGLTPQGDDQIIVETEDGGDDVLYAAAYTYFWRGKRDLEKPKPTRMTERLNPTIGFSLNDPGKHALAGISYDGGHFVFTLGVHGARVTRLAPDAGAKVGEKFTGTTIPTQKKWQTGIFFGVTVDARAARALLDTILPGS